MKDLRLGIRTTFQAFSFVFKNKLGHYFLYPIAITTFLLIVAKNLIELSVEKVKGWIFNWLDIVPVDGSGVSGVKGNLSFLWENLGQVLTDGAISLIMWIIMFYLTHKVIKYVTLILMSPVMAYLSERTEQILTGNEYPFNWNQFLKDIWRGVILAIRNFCIEMGLVILIWIVGLVLSMIPGVNLLMFIIAPAFAVLTFLIGAYFYGFSTIDYTNERRKLTVKQSVQFIRKNKWLAIGNGALFMLFISIPVLGAYLGPVFATIMCTAGATMAIHEKVGLDKHDDYMLMTQKDKKK